MSVNQRFAPTLVTKCLALAASAENKNEDSNEYEKEVVASYRSLETLNETLEYEQRQPSEEEKKAAVEWLERILTAKHVHADEWAERMEELRNFPNS